METKNQGKWDNLHKFKFTDSIAFRLPFIITVYSFLAFIGFNVLVILIAGVAFEKILIVAAISFFAICCTLSATFYYLHKKVTGPMLKMVNCIFSFKDSDGSNYKQNLVRFEALDIKTGNEVQVLYEASLRVAKAEAQFIEGYHQEKQNLVETKKLAEYDPLTGVKSKVAYDIFTREMDQKIKNGTAGDFAIVFIDINNLKYVNDTFGHEKGNKYIVNNVSMIQDVYKGSEIYRIGGDEFVVVLEDENFKNRINLYHEFINRRAEYYTNDYTGISMAIGFSIYEPKYDNSIKDVEMEADKWMYHDKKEFKREQTGEATE